MQEAVPSCPAPVEIQPWTPNNDHHPGVGLRGFLKVICPMGTDDSRSRDFQLPSCQGLAALTSASSHFQLCPSTPLPPASSMGTSPPLTALARQPGALPWGSWRSKKSLLGFVNNSQWLRTQEHPPPLFLIPAVSARHLCAGPRGHIITSALYKGHTALGHGHPPTGTRCLT